MSSVLGTLPLPWPFEREIFQLALLAGLSVGCTAPLIGAFLVQRRMSLMGDGLGHLAFAGVGLALLTDSSPLWVAFTVVVIGALAVERIRRRSRDSGDLALSLIFYSGLAAGNVLIGKARAGGNAESYLFGALATVTRGETVVLLALAGGIVAVITVLGRPLFSVLLDEEAAQVSGLPVRPLNDLLMVLTALNVVAGMRTVGILLVSALMVLPVGAAKSVTTSFSGLLRAASAIGALSIVCGMVIARAFDLFPGGTIVLTCAGIFLLCSAASPLLRSRR